MPVLGILLPATPTRGPRAATFLPYCAEWVVNTTDKVWLPSRTPAEVTEALHEHFYAAWESTSNGKYFRAPALEQLNVSEPQRRPSPTCASTSPT